jgi:hypothetical protein
VSLALALAGCSSSPEPAAEPQPTAVPSGEPGPSETAAAPVASAPAPAPDLAIETLAGLWRVERVDAAGGTAPGPDDKRLVKAVLEVSREQMNWSYRPAPALPGNDICSGPHLAPVDDAALVRRVADGLQRLGAGSAPPALAGIDCDDGMWGPGAVGSAYIARLDADRMAMTWFGDSVLLLKRFKPAPKAGQMQADQPLHASDYSR